MRIMYLMYGWNDVMPEEQQQLAEKVSLTPDFGWRRGLPLR
jgi:hypothetical protein